MCVKRPVFLKIWLVIMLLSGTIGFLTSIFGGSYIAQAYPNAPSWMNLFLVANSAINLIAYGLLWIWKKIGFYILILIAVVTSVLHITLFGLKISTDIFAIIAIVVIYLAMRPVWPNFK